MSVDVQCEAKIDVAWPAPEREPKVMTCRTSELLSRARAGETEALGELCASYGSYLRMVVRSGMGKRLREHVEVSDVVQEVLVEVVRQFPRFTGQNDAAVLGWLRRLAGQRLADQGRYHCRSKRGGDALPLDRASESGGLADLGSGRMLDLLALSQTSPSQVVSKREQFDLLADALASLAEPEADVLWLYFAESLTFEAIGQRLNLKRKSVSRIVAQSLKKLKRSLEGPPGGALKYDDGTTY
jgi:RNA polymerase sigma-70 factor (subfamily 1)